MLRPEKSWRPIVTLEVDGQHKHEIALGVDGQNPNQRDIMHLCVAFPMYLACIPDFRRHHVHHKTEIELIVWHKSQSKAKSRKRRRRVASAAMLLGEVMKEQGTDPCEASMLLCIARSRAFIDRRRTSLVRRPHRTKKVCSAKAPALRFSPCPPTTATAGRFA